MSIPIHCRATEKLHPRELSPWPNNPRRHPENQLRTIIRIIEALGWREPIVVSARSGNITKGNGRHAAALLAGWDLVPVERQEYASEAEELADVIADNRIQELNFNDGEKLAAMLRELEAGQADLTLTGFDQAFIDAMLQQAKETITLDMNEQSNPDDGNIKQVILTFPAEEFDVIAGRLQRFAAKEKFASASEAVLALLRRLAPCSQS
jgi:ParB-like chromosome segregation protein Spo0J